MTTTPCSAQIQRWGQWWVVSGGQGAGVEGPPKTCPPATPSRERKGTAGRVRKEPGVSPMPAVHLRDDGGPARTVADAGERGARGQRVCEGGACGMQGSEGSQPRAA